MSAKRTVVVVGVLAVLSVAPMVYAEGSLSDDRLNAIRTNCVQAQISIQRVQESDKLTRINRGYRYESILKLMTSFNSRVAENKIDAPALITIVSDYQKNWDAFRDDYSNYDDALTKIARMDCKSQPTTFNDQLLMLREKRDGLNGRVKQFDVLLDKYQSGIDEIKQTQDKI